MTSKRPASTSVPLPVSGVDLRSLPIGPTEAFVLSRVDGRATEGEIALSTGLGAGDVSLALLRLEELGAVRLPIGVSSKPPRASGPPGEGTPPAARSVVVTQEAPEPAAAAGPLPYPAAELEEAPDLDRDRKHLILSTFYKLDRTTHYQLLDVTETAEKKAIKSAYFAKVALFHPDKYFGKALGAFKPRLEKIFRQVTEAHDVLTRKQPRAEYDRYLASLRATGALEEADAEHARALEQLREELEREARADSPSQPRNSAPPPAGSRASSNPPDPTSAPPPAPNTTPRPSPLTTEERRRALARKLGVGSGSIPAPAASPSRPSDPVSSPPPDIRQASARAAAEDALRRRYEERLRAAGERRLKGYLEQAEEALKAGNPVQAATAFRLAISLKPDDVALSARYEEVELQSAASLADRYLEQGRYGERQRQFKEAAEAYERAARGRPAAQIFERAAHCLLEARGDARKATELARKAVELAPDGAAYRIVLARAYARAGLEQSALGELERASAHHPSDDTIKDWIKRVKRGEV